MLIAAALTAAVCGCASRARQVNEGDLESAIQAASETPSANSWQLSNGLLVYYMKDAELPLVSGLLLMKGGKLWDEQGAVVAALGDQMRQGGAGEFGAEKLDQELDRLSAAISSGFGQEAGRVSFSCLKQDLHKVFPRFADVIQRPRFEADRLELWKIQALDGIRRRIDDPDTVAGSAFGQLIYGDRGYGRVPVSSDVVKISRLELLKAHRHLVRPNQAVLALSGDIEQEEVRALIERYLGGWERRASDLEAPFTEFRSAPPGIYFIEQELAQATIIAGSQGVVWRTPDFAAIDAFNNIFGSGSFGSRLMQTVRTKLGLAYGVYGVIAPNMYRGKNIIGFQTKAASAGEALYAGLSELNKMQTEAPSNYELIETKQALLNSYIFGVDHPSQIVERAAQYKLLGFPDSHDQEYLNKVRDLTPEEIKQVAASRWDITQLIIVVVGNEEAYQSLSQVIQQEGSPLKGMSIRKARFTEKLEL
ncbi:MAG: hypothetical protein DCC75_06335 [Proteobacteria bacterium]|nr:MAG: hypothetical protein DCC75_06335 [Pseudomonadota bacterium]